MADEKLLWKLEGLHTAETVAEALGISRQAAINLVSRLKKECYVTTRGGGRQKRLYRITMRKQRLRDPGMFDIINRYSPMKLNPWYDHQVHGPYGPEEALVDAVQTKSFRVILVSMRLFSHIRDWKKLYTLAGKKDCWQQIGALYDLARMHFRVARMPKKYQLVAGRSWKRMTQLGDRGNFPNIQSKWHVYVPFNKNDLGEIV